MSSYLELTGRPYVEGRTDCYGLMRDYFALTWDLKLPNVARPSRFWEAGLDLYGAYARHGFELLLHRHYQPGDVLLMPIMTAVNSHAAVVVDTNQILHHLPDQLSRVDTLRPRWSNRATAVLRHPKVTAQLQAQEVVIPIEDLIRAPILRRRDVQEAIAREVEDRG